MRTWRSILVCTAGALALAAAASAQSAVVTGIDATPGVKALQQHPQAQAPKGPSTYGTTYTTYYNVDAFEMTPYTSGATWGGVNNGQLRYLSNVSGFALQAGIHLPAGALVTFIELDYYDNSATGQVIASLGVCDYDGISCAFQSGSCDGTATVCSDVAGVPGYDFSTADLTGDAITVDNLNNRYILFAGNTTTDGSTAISKVIIGYQLQVSAAPGAPTFNDVPLSDFAFQYIEALSASGITGGCGANPPFVPPVYCPDAFVTRRQMGIFISKALGLQWQ